VFDKNLVSQFHLLDRAASDETWHRRLGGRQGTRLRRPRRKTPTRSIAGGPTRSGVGGIVGLPHTFAGILVGQRVGRRLLYRGTVEWGLGMRTAQDLLRRARQRSGLNFEPARDLGLTGRRLFHVLRITDHRPGGPAR
jgi:hypothetical protein